MSRKQTIVKTAVPLVILLAGMAVMVMMIKSRPAPKKQPKIDTGALVHVLPVEFQARQALVAETGTVQPQQEITIIPQVKGRVVHVDPDFVAGGFFSKGDLLFAIEATDYELAVEKAKATLARAELELATIESRARIARQEWQELNRDRTTEPNPLVLYEPQLMDARASRAGAAASLKQAELDLARTQVRAPFNCRVRSEDIGWGQYVKEGTQVAVVAGTDRAEIIVPLSLSAMTWLHIPASEEDETGSAAVVRLDLAGESYQWPGRLVRSLGEVDPKGRMARVVVAVDHPYGRQVGNSAKPDLLPGMFVDVVLYGRELGKIVVLPREALRENDTVWIMDKEGKLRIRKVEILRFEGEEAFVGAGLAQGEQVVLTTLSGAADGMKLRLADRGGPL